MDGMEGEAPGATGVALGFPFVFMKGDGLGAEYDGVAGPIVVWGNGTIGLGGVAVAGVVVCIPVENDPTCGGGKNADVLGCVGAFGAERYDSSCTFCAAVPS